MQKNILSLIYHTRMELNRVLIVIKTKKPRARSASTLKSVISDLKYFGVAYHVEARDRIKKAYATDLIIPIGGDGTFLAASHIAGNVPLLGINPDPTRSVGFFCGAVKSTFRKILLDIISDKRKPIEVPLIQTKINGRTLPILALNDVLFAGSTPAETARYQIIIGRTREQQKSSGVWISAGPGSTAAINSAGAKPLGISSRKLQYLVREPCPLPDRKYKLLHDVLKQGSRICIRSSMRDGFVYIDGHWHAYPVPRGARISCKVFSQTLKLFV
ncbi:MAG: NAD(+)/NADH kinase [Pseudomonadota bacterium]